MRDAITPTRRLSENPLEIYPRNEGPPVQPKSPARASNANIAVPPLLIEADARLNVPGHKIATDIPQSAKPTNEKRGIGKRNKKI